jgi:bacteriocin biosynthesis cyclodehydratase domain-containing protein
MRPLRPEALDAPVQLVFDGRFATKVAAATAEVLEPSHQTSLVPLAELTAGPAQLMATGKATVLITARFDWREVHRFDAASHRVRRPWCFVGYAYPYVFVGPYVSPTGGPCYLCLQVRLKQHGRTEIPLDGVHLPVPGGHVEGIPPHLVHSVAGLLSGLLDAADGARPRSVALLHVNGLKVRSEALVGVHHCGRCADPATDERGHARLLRVGRELWEA